MSLPITNNLDQSLKKTQVTPLLVVKFDDWPIIYGNVNIQKYVRVGDPDLLIGNDWIIGGFRLLENQSPYILFNTGTTTRISQKVDPAKGQSASVQQMVLSMIDLNDEISNLVSVGGAFPDILGKGLTIFQGEMDTSWPEDFNPIIRGVVQSVESGQGVVNLIISNADEKKRVSILPKITSKLTDGLDYRSVQFQDLFYQNVEDVTNQVTISYVAGGMAGSESVIVTGFSIQVQIQNGGSTASQIKKAIENHPDANQLVTVKVMGDSGIGQFIGSTITGISLNANVLSADDFYLPADMGSFRTYLKTKDELIEYSNKSMNQFLSLARAQSISGADGEGFYQKPETEVQQVIRLKENGMNIALKLMLSQAPAFYAENILAQSIVYFNTLVSIPNAIFFKGVYLETDHGVTAGDKVTVTMAGEVSNNLVDSEIIETGIVNGGSYIVLSDTLTLETTTTALVSFKSKYNVLPIGFGMKPNEVDVAQHVFIRDTFLPQFELDIYVKEIVDGKGFLEKEVYLPMTVFSVPRKGRSSCVYTVAPLATYEILSIDSTTVDEDSIKSLKVGRSTSENFYNQVQFSYDYNPLDDSFLSNLNQPTIVDQSERPVGIKPFVQMFKGIRSSSDGETLAIRSADRLLRRYQRGAEFIKNIKLNFKSGYKLEIGDIVSVDFKSLQLTDFNKGSRDGDVKLMEVLNRIIDNKTGEVIIDVVNTTFGVGDRFGLISPSSLSGIGSTTSKIILQKSFTTREVLPESLKWNGYIGQKILIHDEFWNFQYETFIRGFDNNNPQGMSIDPIPMAIGENWILQAIEYPNDVDPRVQSFWKNRHAYASPTVIPEFASMQQDEILISNADLGRFFVGSIIRVHDYSFMIDSGDVTVTEIIGNTVKVNKPLGFLADPTHFINLIGFPDKQQAYRII